MSHIYLNLYKWVAAKALAFPDRPEDSPEGIDIPQPTRLDRCRFIGIVQAPTHPEK
jgi:hypothetical protein